jgi:hypothetical protein
MSRLRNIPQSGPEQVADALAGVGRQLRSIRAQQVRMVQRGAVSVAGPQNVADSAALTAINGTDLQITVPTLDSQLRVYAEMRLPEHTPTAWDLAVYLREDGVSVGPLMAVEDGAGTDGRKVCTGMGYNPGVGAFYSGGFGYAIPPWGTPHQYQPSGVGTHTYSLAVEGTDLGGGSAPAFSGGWAIQDVKLWIEVV